MVASVLNLSPFLLDSGIMQETKECQKGHVDFSSSSSFSSAPEFYLWLPVPLISSLQQKRLRILFSLGYPDCDAHIVRVITEFPHQLLITYLHLDLIIPFALAVMDITCLGSKHHSNQTSVKHFGSGIFGMANSGLFLHRLLGG